MNILIVAASRSGWTAGIAEWIADEIRQAGHQVTLAPADSAPSPNGFDAAFVGSGIRAGKWEEAGSAYLTAHADESRDCRHPAGQGQEEVEGYDRRGLL